MLKAFVLYTRRTYALEIKKHLPRKLEFFTVIITSSVKQTIAHDAASSSMMLIIEIEKQEKVPNKEDRFGRSGCCRLNSRSIFNDLINTHTGTYWTPLVSTARDQETCPPPPLRPRRPGQVTYAREIGPCDRAVGFRVSRVIYGDNCGARRN